MASQFRTVLQSRHAGAAFQAQPGHFLRCHDFDLEFSSLCHRAARQVRACESFGKSQVVLDHRAQPSLPTRRHSLDHNGGESLARPVDSGRQTRRTTAHDHEIVERALRPDLEPDLFGNLRIARLRQHGTVWESDERQPRCDAAVLLQETARFLIPLDVEPFERHTVPCQEIAGLMGLRGEAIAHDGQPRSRQIVILPLIQYDVPRKLAHGGPNPNPQRSE